MNNRRSLALREALAVVVRYPLSPDNEWRRANPKLYKKYKREMREMRKRVRKLIAKEKEGDETYLH